jgi:methyltransferase
VRHPNYAAVFAELAALPLIHSAWITAATGSAVHAWVLSRRIALEESVLHGHAEYVAVMAGKPRFLPHAGRIFRLKAEATE